MNIALRTWSSVPVVVRAIINGLLVAAAGILPWAFMAKLNITYTPEIPWAVVVNAFYLWFFWKYVRGKGWPQSTSESRRINSRANAVPDSIWGPAIIAGITGIAAMLAFQSVYGRMVALPQQSTQDLSNVPLISLVFMVIMGSIVAGMVEEAAYRGYMQGPIERQYGPVAAITVTGFVFALVHFSHPEVGVKLIPFYMVVSAVYGTLTYLTNSIMPAVFLHAGGNMLGAIDLFARGQSEWQAGGEANALIWETGPDASFWISTLALVVLTSISVWAYAALGRAVKE